MPSRKLLILYGSQTGTAQDVAERIERDGRRRLFATDVSAMDDYNVTNFPQENVVVIVVSTTGQGDPPDNMKRFWKFLLRRNLPLDSLHGMSVAVLGLGDSSYAKFNFIAKKLWKRLIQLGARPIKGISLGLADDQHELGADSVIYPWLDILWPSLLDTFPLLPGEVVLDDATLVSSKYTVMIKNEEEPKKLNEDTDHNRGNHYSKNNPFLAKLVSNHRVTAKDHFQDTRLIRFDLSDSKMTFTPGDVIVVQPQNVDDVVMQFLTCLKLDGRKFVSLTPNDSGKCMPRLLKECRTVRDIAEKYLDLQSRPTRYFFEVLAFFCNSEVEKEKLLEFCTAEGQEELYSYCYRPRRTCLEVLWDFREAASNIPFNYILDMMSMIKPRSFSIASSLSYSPGCAEILMAVVKYKTKLHEPRHGLCSTWLSSLDPSTGDHFVPVWIEKGTFSYEKKCHLPMIMIGPGTGCAPFRAFIQENSLNQRKESYLFFGCRSESKDFYFKDEWNLFQINNFLHLKTAFSRDQDKKVYVQHRLAESSSLVYKLITEKQCTVFVAGNSKDMPKAVMECLEDILQSGGLMDRIQATEYIKDMDRASRLQFETWS